MPSSNNEQDFISSPHFSAEDADIFFTSSDGIRFHIHQRNLEVTSGRFLTMARQTNNVLSETSATLELLFNFVYPQRLPPLAGEKFSTVIALAEAAEKYEVFSAMLVCEFRMRKVVETYPAEVLRYAIKHVYKGLVGEAAMFCLDIPMDNVSDMLDDEDAVLWARYHHMWVKYIKRAICLASDRAA